MRSALAAILGATLVIAVFLAVSLYRAQRAAAPPSAEAGVQIGGAFSLIDHTGARVTDEDFRGRAMLVFFGFTYCPDVCPFTLQALSSALDQLGDDAAAFQPILISVDPERDTPEQLAVYVESNGFPDDLVGLTGSPEEIRAVADAYRADYAVIRDDESLADYLIEHTSVIYLMDAQGRFVEPFTHAATPAEIAAGLRRYLDRGGRPVGTGR